MKLPTIKVITGICFIFNTGCTTIGQQIVNRDGTVQIKQENVNFGASNGGTQVYPITEVVESPEPQVVIVERRLKIEEIGTDPVIDAELRRLRQINWKYQQYDRSPQERIVTNTNNSPGISFYANTINVDEINLNRGNDSN